MKVNEILRQKRLEKDLTLDDVARMVGVSAATISRWESGDIANMKRDKIVKLAKALGISPALIMGWDDDAYNDSKNQPYYLDPKVAELADFMHKNPKYCVLFDAARNVKEEDILFVKEMIDRMRGPNE